MQTSSIININSVTQDNFHPAYVDAFQLMHEVTELPFSKLMIHY